MKKYEFTGKERVISFYGGSTTVKRIRALIDIPRHDVEEGDLGGWIENESCLSHEGDCWVKDCSAVYNEGVVMGNVLLDSGFSDMQGEDKPIYTRVQNSRISGEGFIEDSIVDNSYIWGSRVYLRDAKVYSSRLKGNMNLMDSEVSRILLSQDGEGAVSIRKSHIIQKKGFLRIQNVEGEELLLSEVSFEVFPYKYDHFIAGKGQISHLHGEIEKLNIYGNFEIKYVSINKGKLETTEKNQHLRLIGSENEPILMEAAYLLLHDTLISGNGIQLSGEIFISNSILSDSIKVENLSKRLLEIKKVTMNDCSYVSKISRTRQHVMKDMNLANDDYLII